MASGKAVRVRTRAAGPQRALDIPVGLEGTMEVTRVGYGGQPEETVQIRVPSFIGPTGRIRVEGSITRNMGDYNSVKIGVCVEMPCYATDSEANRCYSFCSNKVDDKLAEELRIATGADEEAGQV